MVISLPLWVHLHDYTNLHLLRQANNYYCFEISAVFLLFNSCINNGFSILRCAICYINSSISNVCVCKYQKNHFMLNLHHSTIWPSPQKLDLLLMTNGKLDTLTQYTVLQLYLQVSGNFFLVKLCRKESLHQREYGEHKKHVPWCCGLSVVLYCAVFSR